MLRPDVLRCLVRGADDASEDGAGAADGEGVEVVVERDCGERARYAEDVGVGEGGEGGAGGC